MEAQVKINFLAKLNLKILSNKIYNQLTLSYYKRGYYKWATFNLWPVITGLY